MPAFSFTNANFQVVLLSFGFLVQCAWRRVRHHLQYTVFHKFSGPGRCCLPQCFEQSWIHLKVGGGSHSFILSDRSPWFVNIFSEPGIAIPAGNCLFTDNMLCWQKCLPWKPLHSACHLDAQLVRIGFILEGNGGKMCPVYWLHALSLYLLHWFISHILSEMCVASLASWYLETSSRHIADICTKKLEQNARLCIRAFCNELSARSRLPWPSFIEWEFVAELIAVTFSPLSALLKKSAFPGLQYFTV